MSRNLQDRLADALRARGFSELPHSSRRFRKFATSREESFYFVGRSGALRVGRNVTDSISLERTTFRRQLLEEVPT
jgi:hypothetical protein